MQTGSNLVASRRSQNSKFQLSPVYTEMIESAVEILDLVKIYYLEHLFSLDFMEDLAVFREIGQPHD